MSPAAEVLLVAQRELRKNIRSAKGIVLLGLSLLGGVAVALLFTWLEKMKREKLGTAPPEVVAEFQRQLVLGLGDGDEALGAALVKAPIELFYAFKFTIWVAPLLVGLLGFDAVSGELQHRTVSVLDGPRTPRVLLRRKGARALGRGLLAHVPHPRLHLGDRDRARRAGRRSHRVGAEVLARLAADQPGVVRHRAARGSQFRVPFLSLLVTLGSFFVLWIVYLVGASGKIPPLAYVYPNLYDNWLLHPHPDRLLEGLAICLGSAALYVAAGAALFARRDV